MKRTQVATGLLVRLLAALAFGIAPLLIGTSALASEPRFATYLGGSDRDGTVFVEDGMDGGSVLVGWTLSADFPAMHPFADLEGGGDIFVTSYDHAGQIIFSTVIGGHASDFPTACRVSADGSITLLGVTHSSDFPTKNPFQKKYRGLTDSFVLRLDGRGELVYSTFLGGNSEDLFTLLDVDDAGCVYVAGTTDSSNYPTTRGAVSRHFNTRRYSPHPGSDGAVTKLDPIGRAVYSTYISGRQTDGIRAIHALTGGGVLILGATNSDNFKTLNSPQPKLADYVDTFLVRLDATGGLVYSQLFGGSMFDRPIWSDMRDDGSIVVWGSTDSLDLPVVNAFQPSIENRGSYVLRVDAEGKQVYATYVGCIQPPDRDGSFYVDADENVYISSSMPQAYLDEFPVVSALVVNHRGTDGTLTKIAADGRCVYSTWIGGSGVEYIASMHVDAAANVTLIGATGSSDFPTVNGTPVRLNGTDDMFVMKLDEIGELVYSSFFGGSQGDGLLESAVSASGDVYLLGRTVSPDFPEKPAAFGRGPNEEGFVARFDPGGRLVFSALLGADIDNGDSSARIHGRPDGGVVVASLASDAELGELHQVNQLPSGDGVDDAMVIVFSPEGHPLVSTYLGGSSADRLASVRFDPTGAITITMSTVSSDLQVREAAQPAFGGATDVFLMSIAP